MTLLEVYWLLSDTTPHGVWLINHSESNENRIHSSCLVWFTTMCDPARTTHCDPKSVRSAVKQSCICQRLLEMFRTKNKSNLHTKEQHFFFLFSSIMKPVRVFFYNWYLKYHECYKMYNLIGWSVELPPHQINNNLIIILLYWSPWHTKQSRCLLTLRLEHLLSNCGTDTIHFSSLLPPLIQKKRKESVSMNSWEVLD